MSQTKETNRHHGNGTHGHDRAALLEEIRAGRGVTVGGLRAYNEAELDYALDRLKSAQAEVERGTEPVNGTEDGLDAMTVAKLKELAVAEGIEISPDHKTKASIAEAIREGRAANARKLTESAPPVPPTDNPNLGTDPNASTDGTNLNPGGEGTDPNSGNDGK